MSSLYLKMIAIALWCGGPTPNGFVTGSGQVWSIAEHKKCRREMQQCLQSKATHLQVESCFMGRVDGVAVK